jgi:hypothetical protein
MEGDFVMSMSESEIKVRMREAMIFGYANSGIQAKGIRDGNWDDNYAGKAIAQALRDYHRPLSKIVPVNLDLVMAQEVCAEAYEWAGSSASVADDYRKGKYDEGDLQMYIALTVAKRIRAEMAK